MKTRKPPTTITGRPIITDKGITGHALQITSLKDDDVMLWESRYGEIMSDDVKAVRFTDREPQVLVDALAQLMNGAPADAVLETLVAVDDVEIALYTAQRFASIVQVLAQKARGW